MSGGSFDYVCYDMDDPEYAYRSQRKLLEMREYCEGLFPDAIPHIDDMLQFINAFQEAYLEKGARIKDLLQAIEWERSSDWSEISVHKAIANLKAKQE